MNLNITACIAFTTINKKILKKYSENKLVFTFYETTVCY